MRQTEILRHDRSVFQGAWERFPRERDLRHSFAAIGTENGAVAVFNEYHLSLLWECPYPGKCRRS